MNIDALTMSSTIRRWAELLNDAESVNDARKIASRNVGSFRADGSGFSITDANGAEIAFKMEDGRYRVSGGGGEQELPPLLGDSKQSFRIASANRFVDVKSIKQICRGLRVSRNTVRKVIRSGATEFTYDRTTQPRPKIDPWRSDLDALLAENARRPKRERLTVIRIYEELRNRGYAKANRHPRHSGHDDLGGVRRGAVEPGAVCRSVRWIPRRPGVGVQDLPRALRQEPLLGGRPRGRERQGSTS